MTEPTYQDAQLIIQIAQYWATAGIQKSLTWLWSDKYLPDYDEFITKYPVGSKQFGHANAVCGAMEMLGSFHKHGLLNSELLFDWLAVDLIWGRVGGFARGIRESAGDKRLYENFEALAKAQSG